MIELSVRGERQLIPSIVVCNSVVLIRGSILKTAEIFDEYWAEARHLPDPVAVLRKCKDARPRPDLFTFTQRVPDTTPRYAYFMQWHNIAALPLCSYDHWLSKQVTPATRRNVRGSHNRGVVVKICEFDDAYVGGIKSIYDESPIRQGRHFWHYGKDVETVRAENGTYADRAMFLAAYVEDEMIGYLKLVWDERTAAIMQVMSKTRYYDKRPNNALIAEAVKQCCLRKVEYLLYESFVYGNKTQSSLTDFKRSNGFVRMDLPRYFVPLTAKGAIALRLGLHQHPKERLPSWIRNRWPEIRTTWYRYTRRQQAVGS
jgi:hypothetical protein